MHKDKDKNNLFDSSDSGDMENGGQRDEQQSYDKDFLDQLASDDEIPNSKDVKGFSRVGEPKDASKRMHFDRYKISGDKVLNARRKQAVVAKKTEQLGNAASKKKDKRKKFFIIGIVVAVILVAVAIFAMIFMNSKNQSTFSQQDVTFTVEGVDQIKSGEEMTYTIKGKTNNKATLTNVELVVTYPDKFTFVSSAPKASNSLNNRWSIADLKTGESFEIQLKGRVIGEQETIASLNAKLNYRPSNFNADFSEETSLSTTLLSPAISLDIEYPKQAISGEEIDYVIRYTNTSQDIITDAIVNVELPDNFKLGITKPALADSKKVMWELGRLNARQSGVIKVTGTINGNEGETKRTTIQLGTVDANDQLIVEIEDVALTKLVQSSVSLEQTMNNEKSIVVKPGQELQFEIAYKNTGSTGLRGVTIQENLTTDSLDLATAEIVGGSISGKTVTWNSSGVPELEVVDAGESGKVSFKVKLKKTLTLTTETQKGLKVVGTATFQSSSLKDKIESNTVQATVDTVIKLSVEARYYDFENQLAVGSGALPPKVGSTTTYRVYVTVTNSTNDAQDAIATIKLAPGVSWADDATVTVGDKLQFNTSTNKVTWKIGNIPAGSGNVSGALEASFLVSVTPTVNQVGQVLDLTADGGTLDATDALTTTKLTSSDQKLTTKLEFDDNAVGKERVTN